MKRYKDIYQKIYDMDNLRLAYQKAVRGKKSRDVVKNVADNLEAKLSELQKTLIDETYVPSPYTRKTIIDRASSKIREIFVPKFFPDQIVQWALMLQIEPILKKGMYDFCCASVVGRGASKGIKVVRKWLSTDYKNTKYCLVGDVKKFYPSVDQNLLFEKFKRKIKDEKTLNLISKIIFSVDKGLPIGNYTSQWFANFFMQDFDHFVKEKLKIKHYVRYMDDMIFLSPNKRKLHKQKDEIENFLKQDNLNLKSNWQIFKVGDDKTGRPIDFLGYKFYRNFTTLRGKTFLRATRRIRKVAKKEYLTAKDACAVVSYNARMKICSGNKLYCTHIANYVNISECRFKISFHDRKIQERKNAVT